MLPTGALVVALLQVTECDGSQNTAQHEQQGEVELLSFSSHYNITQVPTSTCWTLDNWTIDILHDASNIVSCCYMFY